MTNSRNHLGCAVAATIMAGAIFAAGAASAEEDERLARVFEAVCVKPADAKAREVAARALGLRTPPKSFQPSAPNSRGTTLELNVWKALENRMLILYSQSEPFPGTKDLPALTCYAILTPGRADALADVASALGVTLSAEGGSSDMIAFEDSPDGRKLLDMNDKAAMDAALMAGSLRVVNLGRRNSKDDAATMMLLRPTTR